MHFAIVWWARHIVHRHTALVGSLISIIFTFNENRQHSYLGLSKTHTKYRIDTGYSACVEKKPTKQSVSYMNRKKENRGKCFCCYLGRHTLMTYAYSREWARFLLETEHTLNIVCTSRAGGGNDALLNRKPVVPSKTFGHSLRGGGVAGEANHQESFLCRCQKSSPCS